MDELLILKMGCCEASHKNIVLVDFLIVTFKYGELVPTGRYYIFLTRTVYRKLQDKVYNKYYNNFLCITKRVPSRTRGVDEPHFSVICSSPVEQYLNSVAVMAITYQLLPWLSQSLQSSWE